MTFFAPLALVLLTLATSAVASLDESACKSDPTEDTVSLLQTGKTIQELKSEADCTCYNWKQTYEEESSICGLTNEYYSVTGKTGAALWKNKGEQGVALFNKLLNSPTDEEFCDKFYSRLDHNLCVNVNMGDDHGQWCYVSPNCEDGETPRVTGIKAENWKYCSAPRDTLLRDVNPNDLAKVAKATDLDLSFLHKMSYPLYKDHLWGDVQAFWGLGDKPVSSMPAALRQEMQQIADSHKPYSFDTSVDHHPPHRIVQGMTVYAVEPSPSSNATSPGSWNMLVCVSGCE